MAGESCSGDMLAQPPCLAQLSQAVGLALMLLLKVASTEDKLVESSWRADVPWLIPFFACQKETLELWLQNLVQIITRGSSRSHGPLPVMDHVGEARSVLWRMWQGVWSRVRIEDPQQEGLRMTLFAVAFILQQIPWHSFGARHGRIQLMSISDDSVQCQYSFSIYSGDASFSFLSSFLPFILGRLQGQ